MLFIKLSLPQKGRAIKPARKTLVIAAGGKTENHRPKHQVPP
jgi:hypothetical protein